jgi:hypothetical protein
MSSFLRPGVGEAWAAGPEGPVDEVGDEDLELAALERALEVLRARLVGRDEGQVDLGLERRAELVLGLLGCLLEALERDAVLAEVDAVLLLEASARSVLEHQVVEVFAAEVGVAEVARTVKTPLRSPGWRCRRCRRRGRRPRCAGVRAVEAVGERRRRGLVDDALHVEARRSCPASLVAWRWASSKYAGTVITASVTFSPR